MVTNAEAPEQSPGNRERVADAAYAARDAAVGTVRYAIAGDEKARIRRGALFAIVAASFALAAPLPGLIALILLAWTDAVVES